MEELAEPRPNQRNERRNDMSKASKSSASETCSWKDTKGISRISAHTPSASRPTQPTPNSHRFSSACPMTTVSAHTWAMS